MADTRQAMVLVRQGRALAAKKDMAGAEQRFLTAWSADKTSSDLLMAVAGSLAELGQFETAMAVLEEALQVNGETALICKLMGKMALKMDMQEIAEKVLVRSVQLEPDDAETFADLASSLTNQNKFDDARGVLQIGLGRMPDNALLHDMLGNVIIAQTGDRFEAMMAYAEAVRLEPKNAQYQHNMALACHLDEEAEPYYRKALQFDKRNPQINISFAIFLLQKGRLSEAWDHYRFRNDPALGHRKAARYTHGLKPWPGGNLKGRSLLLCSEQGIGDEILFASVVPPLLQEADGLYVGCDPRLVEIYRRSFPGAVVEGHVDARHYQYRDRSYPEIEAEVRARKAKIDYACPVGSAFAARCPSLDAFRERHGGYLLPDPDRVAALGAQIGVGDGRPKIAIGWRSGNLSAARHQFYMSAQLFIDLAERIDADFYVLQYAMSDEERRVFDSVPNVHLFDEVDMKQDIEANLAILSCVDLYIGPATATQMFAMAVGCPVWLLAQGLPWNFFGEREMRPLYADGSQLFLMYDLRFRKIGYYEAVLEALAERYPGRVTADV